MINTFVSFGHLVSSKGSVLEQGMIIEKEILFFIEEFVDILLRAP